MQLHAFVKFGVRRLFDQRDTLPRRVLLERVYLLGGGAVLLSVSWHQSRCNPYSRTATPMLRAAPSIMRMAASTSLAFKSFILISAISRTLARGMVPAIARPGVPPPFSMLAAFLI